MAVANQITLVYFGSIFLHQRVTGQPQISKEILTWDTTLILNSSERLHLKNLVGDMFVKIKDDLARLKLANFLDSQRQGYFRKLQTQNLYVYEHNNYAECSSVKLSQFKVCSDIKESVNLIYNSIHDNADEFLPFFYPNPVLAGLYDRMYVQCTSEVRKQKIETWKDSVLFVTANKVYRNDKDKCFTLDSRDYCHSEDVWSERLAHILKSVYPNEIEVTATKKGAAANDYILTKLPKGTTLKMILFHGVPDLVVNSYPLMVHQGCIENKQKNEFTPYVPSSPIPDQCGQLLACVHQHMMVKYLRKLMNGEDCTCVEGWGTFIVRKSDIFLFSMSISNEGLQINANSFISCSSEIAMCCYVMDKFINFINTQKM